MMLNKNFKLVLICVGIIIIIALGMFTTGPRNSNVQGAAITGTKISLSELQNDIYPKFICPCCGNTIDKCGCGTATEMKNHINSLADEGLSEKEILITAIKKYGITSLASSSLQEEIKEEIIKTASKNSPRIVIEPNFYDFGDVSQSKGVTTTTFKVRNEGKSDLIIDNMDSSCMCTTASIIFNGIEGPRFGMSMHGNPEGWSVRIPPRGEAELKVYYDPDVHGELRGLITRTISIFSNDPIDFQKQIRIELNQIP